MLKLTNSKVALAKDESAIFIDIYGTALHKSVVTWNSVPLQMSESDWSSYLFSLKSFPYLSHSINIHWFNVRNSSHSVYDHPYILALTNSGLEVRTLDPKFLIQSLELYKPKILALGK